VSNIIAAIARSIIGITGDITPSNEINNVAKVDFILNL
jgi:hypothetical protein